MTTKNIVNIQDNKLDFYVNGTNRFDVTLRGTNYLSVEETTGYIIAQRTSSNTTKRAATYDFQGYISNINNHDLKNLGDVDATSLAADQLLQYDGTSWKNVPTTSVGATELSYTDGSNNGTLDLNNGIIEFAGTADQIVTLATDSGDNGKVQFSLADDVIVQNSLTVGTNRFSCFIRDFSDGFLIGTTNNTANLIFNSDGDYALNSYFNSSGVTNYFYDASEGSLALSAPNLFSIKVGTSGGLLDPVITVDTTNTTVKNNLIIDGNLTVKGTSTILNTEVKLIEDPLIELNYLEGAHVGNSDIGFFGRYATDNYTGFFYDTSGSNFKVFDSMSSNAYAQNMTTITTNIAYVPILAKTFEVEGGYVGKDVYELSDTTSTATIDVVTELIRTYYKTVEGIYCGRLIAYSRASTVNSEYLNYAVTTLNYVSVVRRWYNPIHFEVTVDIEKKGGNHNYLSYDETYKTISYTPPADAATNTPVVKFRILPIVALN